MKLSSKQDWILELVTKITGDKTMAKMVIEVLTDEGLLVTGYGDNDIDRVVESFTQTFGSTKVSKYDRFAASRLVKAYSVQAVCGVIKLLGQHGQEKYAPVVNNVSDLEKKWVSILNFLRNISTESNIINV